MENIVGTFRRFGDLGPVFQVQEICGEEPDLGIICKIWLIEVDEITTFPLLNILRDSEPAP